MPGMTDQPATAGLSSLQPFDGLAFAKALPDQPGVYRYFDAKGQLLYVGKARNLKKRVGSYFQRTPEDPRIRAMVSRVARAEFTVVPTEVDALVLEHRLIKTGKPKYNIQLKEGQGYPYLHLSTHKKVPQLTVARIKKNDGGRYFGPYPSRQAVYQAHDALQKHFKLRTCLDTFFSHRSRPCLEFQIGRCSAPCVGLIALEEYRLGVAQLEAFLEGRAEGLIADITAAMNEAAARQEYERAAALRDRIGSLRHIQSRVSVERGEGSFDAVALAQVNGVACVSQVRVRDGQVVGVGGFQFSPPWDSQSDALLAEVLAQHYLAREVPMPGRIVVPHALVDQQVLEKALQAKGLGKLVVGARGDDKPHLDLALRNAQAALDAAMLGQRVMTERWSAFSKLTGLDDRAIEDLGDIRVECFDISHTMGQDTVASCVVFGPKGPRKALYRRYNIAGITPGDDFAAMRQAVERRLTGKTPPPDVLLIDGGLGQVAQAVEVARGLAFDFPIIGVAKGPDRIGGEEDLLLDDGQRATHPGPGDPALLFIRAVRDEAHRFAVEGHRRRRDKRAVSSVLETIPGVGPKRRHALLQAFGGLQGLKQASAEAIAQVPGIGPELAEQVVLALR